MKKDVPKSVECGVDLFQDSDHLQTHVNTLIKTIFIKGEYSAIR
jgi:hypothetical protein